MEIMILSIALIMGIAIAFFAKSIQRSWILVPVNIEKPLPEQTQLARFRFAQLNQVRDYTVYRPKLLMAVVIFVLAAFLLQIFLHGDHLWQGFVEKLLIVIVIALFVSSTNIFVALTIIMGISYYLGVWLQWSYFSIGLLVGLVPAAKAGMVLFRNYVAMLRSTQLEIQHRETKEGQALGNWKLIYRQLYRVFLWFVPIMIGYEVVNVWFPAVEQQATNYAFLVFTLTIGLNIIFFTVPMFREMLEKSSISEAANFTEFVEASYREQYSDREPIEKIEVSPVVEKGNPQKRVQEHFDNKGKWLLFQQQQVFSIYTITLYLLSNTILQMLEKSMQMNLVTDASIFGKLQLSQVVTLLTGFCWWANFIFFFGLLGYWANRLNWKSEQKEAEETNTDILWKAYKNKDLQLHCYNQKSMPVLEVVE